LNELEELAELEDFGCSMSVEELLKESTSIIGSPASGSIISSSEELFGGVTSEELDFGP
jgi:hypothetical protein